MSISRAALLKKCPLRKLPLYFVTTKIHLHAKKWPWPRNSRISWSGLSLLLWSILCILYRGNYIKGLAPPSLCNKFSTRSQVHTRNTRNKDKLHIPSFRSATGQRSFSYRAVQLWNDLPESLANIESFNVFKNAIKGRALDEFLNHWRSIGVIIHILYFLNNMVMFYPFQMFILDFCCSY